MNCNVTPVFPKLAKDGDGWRMRWVIGFPPAPKPIPAAAPRCAAVDPKTAAIAKVRADEKARREREVPSRGYITTDWKERTKYGWRGALTGRK